jgi:ribosomal protein S27AE
MTEIIADCRVETAFKKVWRRCPQCSMVFGEEIDGGAYLKIGKLKVQSMRSECGDCGYTIWWYASDRHMRKITEKRKD